MTRVTAPINKLARSLTSRPSVARPAYIVGTSRHQHNAASVAARSELGERDDNNRRFTMAHRPTPSPVPSRNRTVPLMQTFNFRTTTPKAAQLDTSTIDYAVMPSFVEETNDSSFSLRVPLLPDNFFPEREKLDGHAPEAADGPLAAPQIVVVAAHPENVTSVSALTEIEGMGVDGVELKFAHLPEIGDSPDAGVSGGTASDSSMLRDLWKGLVDDLTTPPTSTPKTA